VEQHEDEDMHRSVDLPMSWALPVRRFEWMLGALSATGLLASAAAVWLIWLFLTQPIQVARVVDQGGAGQLARLVASTMYDFVLKVLAWL
jgi:thiol:disulfide interchange protein